MKLRFGGRVRIALAGIAVAAVLGLEAAAASPGASFVVNSTSDALDAQPGDGACATRTATCTLRAAIQEANALAGADFIEVPAGSYEIAIPPLNQNDVTTGDLDITDGVTITGAGAASTIVDAGIPAPGAPPQVHGLDRIFEVAVDGGTVEFSGLTFRDGYAAEYGGAIANNGTAALTVTASVLTNNVAGKAGGAIDNHVGGAIELRDSTVAGNFAYENGSALNNNRDGALTVVNSSVSSNSASAVGLDESLVGAGAISNNAELDTAGTITVSGSTISDNSAGGGRAGATISNDGAGTVTVDRTWFSKNVATGDGGAIFNGSGVVTVDESAFTENAARDGGAIYNAGVKEGRVTVRDSRFSLNSATDRGGAIASGGTGQLTVSDSAFSKNNADEWGGAILSDDKAATAISNSTFSENSGLNGGGFANEGTGLVTVENATFTKNTAFAGTILASGEGGGIHSNSVGEVAISGGAFTGNDARSGGGLSNEGGGTLAISGTRFSGNSADEQGGGILIQSGTVRMVDIDVIGNVADSALEGGGGISYHGDKLVSVGESAAIENSRIRDNKAKGPGGGIDSRGDGPLALTTTAITGNTASIGGGIHHVGDAPLDVRRSALSGNFAESGGGLFSDGDGEAVVENTTVSTNRAGQFGGGLLVSSRLSLGHSTVAGNSAASGGGINNGGGDLVGDGSVFLANTIVANSPTGGNCMGTMTSLGGNVDSADTCQLRELSDQPGTDPRLGALADNGGPTPTHALQAGSPAQENAVCTELDPCPPVDQRGIARPLFDGADAGAYESELAPEGGGGQACTGPTKRPLLADFDNWVSQAAPSANFGSDATLKVESKPGANDRALVHYALPPVPPGCKLVGATLRLHSSSATDGRTLEARRVAAAWSELGVTWANQPATTGSASTTDAGLGIREWDVLAQTLDMYALGNHGFLIRDAFENDLGEQSFHSTEKGTDLPPELILQFDDPDNPPPPGACPTTPQSVSAGGDSWVSEGSPSNNFGSDSTLKVKSQGGSQTGNNARALVRFPLPELPRGCTSIASATLRMEAASAKEGRTLEALQIASDWSESGVTWINQPGTTGPAATLPSAEGALEFAVTPQVLDMYTSANHGFLIRDDEENGVGDEQTLQSRAKLNDGAPELVVAFDDSTPETTIDSGPTSHTTSTDAEFTFSSDRGDASFECSLDGEAFEVCASPHELAGLTEGDHKLEVRSTRKVRAVDPSPATYEWTIAIPPETTLSGPESPRPSPNATLAFTADDPDATFECSLNEEPFTACTSPVGYADLADGPQSVRVRATDQLGNVEPEPAEHAWIVAVPPVTTITGRPADPSNSASASFSFEADEPSSFECRLDAGEWAVCASPQGYDRLADGPHGFAVRATDAAGNPEVEPATYAWTVDTVAPVTTIADGPPELTRSTAASLSFAADEPATFECRLDAGEWAACASPAEYAGLGDGEHHFRVRATDGAGNQAAIPTARSWTVDTTAPTTAVGERPGDPTNLTSASFTFAAYEPATFECALDDEAFAACSSPAEYANLPDGAHAFQVRATDDAGNLGEAATYSWTVDTIAPATTIGEGPTDPTSDASASFTFAADEPADLECALDTETFSDCPAEYTNLPDGPHTFQVRATDKAGNLGEAATYTWTLDTVAPVATIGEGPADPTKLTSASFTFAADGPAELECALDDEAFAACSSPVAYDALTEGRHTFQVRATDEAGNLGEAATYTWRVDTTAPVTTIGEGPADPTRLTSASFTLAADEPAELECAIDGEAFAACSSPADYTNLPDGTHTFQARATDSAGNQGQAATFAWTVDTIAPVSTITDRPADPTTETTASFAFIADEPADFECALDAGAFAACSLPVDYTDLSEGEHRFQVRATDKAGNVGEAATYAWTFDTTAPVTTISEGPADPTRDTFASFTFGADEPANFECALDTETFGDCAAEYTNLPDGPHTFQVRATDDAGNKGEAAGYSWTVDTTAPAITITDAPADPNKLTSASFAFAADEPAGFECALDTGAFAACSETAEYANLAEGRHQFQLRAKDRAGNERTATHAWTVDTIAPVATISEGPADPTKDTSASLTFASDEPATFECALDTETFGDCPADYANLPDGPHTFQVRATDKAGNQGEAATYTWTVDTIAPVATISEGPADPTKDTSASFTFGAGEPAEFECALDAGAFDACQSPTDYSDLGDGSHTFQVRATDEAGNRGEAATYTWTVDTTAPAITITDAPADPTNLTSASFAFAAGEPADFECALDTETFTACSSPVAYDTLTEGRHGFQVRATDNAGNLGEPVSYGWTVDATAPVATISGAPADPSKDTFASFAFSSEPGATFECALDTGAFAACNSPVAYTGLADGQHTFRVRATDRAGNEGVAAAYTWIVDATAAAITIGERPADPSNLDSASFAFSAGEPAMFECALDAGAFAACDSRVGYTGLPDGRHEFRLRATDKAGNTQATAYAWTIDTVAPVATISEGPADPTNETTASFSFGADEHAEFECALDGGAFIACSDMAEYRGLSGGRHEFRVRASDGAGNQGEAATYTWTVDTTAPVATITERPADPTNATAADFVFGADEPAEFECALDAGEFAACGSPISYTRLADGRHTFQVRASDEAGNQGMAAGYSWTVESTAPAATIVSGPADPSRSATATLVFSADEPAEFECAVDNGAYTACSSPVAYDALTDGRHTFRVRARDGAGNTGEPAMYAWTIDTTAPATTFDERPAASTTSTSARFTFAADEPAELECALDSGAYAPCTSPVEHSGLALGAHEFRVRATDTAGNLETAPAIHRWTIETPPDVAAPDTTITARPADLTNASSASFSFTASDDKTPPSQIAFRCRLDSQPTTDCTSPTVYTDLNEGSHTFEVRAVDRAGNADTSPATHSWTIDTTAPQTTIGDGPADPTADATPTIEFSSEPGTTFACRVDTAAFAACTSPHTTATLADGAHTFEVRATDAAGNTDASPASRTITIDTTAPQTTITAAPPATTTSTSASFNFNTTETGSTFACSLDGAAFAACTSPALYTGLSAGAHTFRVRAIDAVGNADATPATHGWTISSPPQGCGPAVTALTAADAWIDQNSPANNKGTDSILKTQSKGPRDNFRALVRFSLPAIPQGCAIESATLRLYAASAKTGRTLHAQRLAGVWSENQVNWSNQPATSGTAAATTSGPGYRDWNVTVDVRDMYEGSNFGFLISDAVENQDAEQQFHSREKGENPPQLVVRLVAAGMT